MGESSGGKDGLPRDHARCGGILQPVRFAAQVQGHETAIFLARLPSGSIEYMEGGVKSGFNHVERETFPKRLLHIKGKRNCRIMQVELTAKSLNAGDVFVLDLGEKLFQWNGTEANKKERTRALEVCKGIRDERVHSIGALAVVLVDQAEPAEVEKFWSELGGKPEGGVAPAVPDTDAADTDMAAQTQLWRLSEVVGDGGRKKLQVTEVTTRPLVRELLDASDAYILAAPAEIWIWIGDGATKSERQKAMLYAQSFLQGKQRPPHTPVTRVVKGAEPTLFTCKFTNWSVAEALDFATVGTVSVGKVAHVTDDRSAESIAGGMVADKEATNK